MTEDLLKEIESIKERNQKVELDKAWETSWTRRLFIALGTYVVAVCWLLIIGDSLSWLKAFWPSVAYIFSTLSLPVVKEWWTKGRSPR